MQEFGATNEFLIRAPDMEEDLLDDEPEPVEIVFYSPEDLERPVELPPELPEPDPVPAPEPEPEPVPEPRPEPEAEVEPPPPENDHPEKVAVIGSGPAGLVCAYDLALTGGADVADPMVFTHTGSLTLGDGAGDDDLYTFRNGLVVVVPSAVDLGGTVVADNDSAITVGDADTPINVVAVNNYFDERCGSLLHRLAARSDGSFIGL